MRLSGSCVVLAALLGAIGCGGGGGGGAGGGAPGSSFDAAFAVTVYGAASPPPAVAGTLASRSAKTYYRGAFLKGLRYVAFTLTDARTVKDGSVLDTVVTIWDSAHHQLAQSDDEWPRFDTDSQVYFEVPADGVYFITVQDCSTVLPAGSCNPGPVTDLAYSLYVSQVGSWYETNAAATNDGSLAHAQAIGFWVPAGQPAGHYAASLVDGNLPGVAAGPLFTFTVPLDTYVAPGMRPRADFFVQPIGPSDGDGSTSNVILEISDYTKTLAWGDQRNFGTGDDPVRGPLQVSLPVTLGKTYYMWVIGAQPPGVSNPTTDYFFIQTEIGSFDPGLKEGEGPTGTGVNDTPATAQQLGTLAGLPGYFALDGNVASASDVDWYEIDPPALTTSATLWCAAARTGSGVAGLAATLYDVSTATTTVLGTFGPESATSDLFSTFPAPGTARSLLEVSAQSVGSSFAQDTDYRCAVTFVPAAGVDWWLHDNLATYPSSDWQTTFGSPAVDAAHGNPAPSLLLPGAGAGIQSTGSFPYSGGRWTYAFDVATDLSGFTGTQSARLEALTPGLFVTLPAFVLDVSGAAPTTNVGCDYSPTHTVSSDSAWHHVAIHVDWTANTYACDWDGAFIGSGAAYQSSPNFTITSSGGGLPVRVDNVSVIQGR